MKSRKRGLGRGLSALLGDAASGQNNDENISESAKKPENAATSSQLQEIGIDQLRAGAFQPRQVFDKAELQNLADSLLRAGMVQPIVARPLRDGKYEIIAGERRWRAAQLAKLHNVPVLVQNFTDGRALEVAIIENVQRSDLNPVEESEGYQRLMDEFDYTQADLAATIGKSRSHIGNMLRLARASADIKAHLVAGRLSMGHARAVLGHPQADQLAMKIIAENLSVRDAEALAADKKTNHAANPQKTGKNKDADTQAVEKTLANHLGLQVDINDRGGKGEMRIGYRTLEQLDALISRLMRR